GPRGIIPHEIRRQVVNPYLCLYNPWADPPEQFPSMADEEKESAAGDAEGQNETELHPMDALLESENYELSAPRRGEIRVGTIVHATEADVLVDIGAKSEGVISSRELEQIPEDQRATLDVGQEINVYVVRPGGRSGAPELSLVRAEEEQDWHQAEELMESKEIFEGEVTGYNKGGLIVKMGQLRGFVPASQVSLARRRRADGETPEDRWGKMVGEHLVAKIIEVDRRRNRLILSERSAAREAREALKERLISELSIGEVRTGHVISLADFGAFVDIGGADGLVHISEISWKRVTNPRELLSVGQEVKVKVLGVDPERNRISLSIRELEENPWDMILSRYDEGQLVEGSITKLTKFGAFAKLSGLEDYGIEGLIHISELSDQHITHPSEVVQEGQTLTLRVIRVDAIRHRIGLSLKMVDSSEFAETDWQTAVQETVEPETVADFDAELEAEAALAGEAEEIEPKEEPESETSEMESEAEPGTEEAETDTVELDAELGTVEAPEIETVEPESEIDEPEAEIEPESTLDREIDADTSTDEDIEPVIEENEDVEAGDMETEDGEGQDLPQVIEETGSPDGAETKS
ncbi:MAG: S1 RNA-binding domain-containing protein, partial [Anaerolineales bacterium]